VYNGQLPRSGISSLGDGVGASNEVAGTLDDVAGMLKVTADAGTLDDVAGMLEETAEVTAGACCMISTCYVSFIQKLTMFSFPDVERDVAGTLDDVAGMSEGIAAATPGACCMISNCSTFRVIQRLTIFSFLYAERASDSNSPT
jgi:hypothetical protein